jgi:hypothetical protein
MLLRSIAGTGLFVLALTGSALADLSDRNAISEDKVQLAQYAQRVNASCGSHIAFSIMYGSYANAVAGPGVRKQSPTEYLMNAGDAIINICTTADGKSAVQGKIKRVVGGFSSSETESLANGVFTYQTSYAGGSVAAAESYLKAHL